MNTPTVRNSLAVAAVVALLFTIGACKQSSGAASSARGVDEPTMTEGGELVFEETFDDQEPGTHWVRGQGEGGRGKWRVEDGWMVGNDIKNDALWLEKELPDEVRIEWDVEAMSPVGDIKVEAFGDGRTHESGYVFIFGGWKNTLDVIARLDEHGNDRKERQTHGVVPDTTYHMAIERTGDTLHWFVNDEHFMSYKDANMLRGEGHEYFAFNIWSAPVRFDNVKVYDLSGAQ
jgi:hypothetical protein